MIKTKRIVGIFLSCILVLGASTSGAAYADNSNKWVVSPSSAEAYIRPDITIEVNGKAKICKDVQGQVIYPLSYNGITYIPVRAISALMKEDLEWVNDTKTVFIGKTLSNPNKSTAKTNIDMSAVADADSITKTAIEVKKVSVMVRPDIRIMYDFKMQNFSDDRGNSFYPIIYNNGTYLPLRAASALIGQKVRWDNDSKTICIGKRLAASEQPILVKPSVATLSAELETSIEVYDEATDAVAKLHRTTDETKLLEIASSVSASLQKSKEETAKLKALDISSYTTEEVAAYKSLCNFSEASEYYILILENIAYMAASKVDYSMLEETFMNYAMDSQKRMDAARETIEDLYEDVY